MLKFMLKPCCWNLFKIADLFAIWLHLSTGRRACTHGKAGSRLDCHADVLVCLFVVTVAKFWYVVIESRLSNSKLHYEFTVLCFWLLSFAWDPLTSFQSHFCSLNFFSKSFLLQLLFYLFIPIWNSFVSVAILIGFLFVGMVQQTLRKLGRCQMTRLI